MTKEAVIIEVRRRAARTRCYGIAGLCISTVVAFSLLLIFISKFDAARDALNKYLDSPLMVTLPGAQTNRDFIETMLYGIFAHLDPEKYSIGKKWRTILGQEQLRLLFVTGLEDAMILISKFDGIVEKIQHESDPT